MQINQILRMLCIDALSPMQSDFIAVAPTTKQLLLLAPTGAGKTLAYLLGIVQRIVGNREQGIGNNEATPLTTTSHSLSPSPTPTPQGQLFPIPYSLFPTTTIVVSPSRELAQQGHDLLRRMKTDTPSACFVGGHATSHDRDTLQRERPRIIFATPGRLLDLLQSGDVRDDGLYAAEENRGIDARSIGLLVLDEYDKCLDEGFTACLTDIASLIPTAADRWLISATQEPANVELFIDKSRAVRLDYTSNEAADRLQTVVVPSPEKDKLQTLAQLLCYVGAEQSIVFVSHRESVERIYQYLRGEGFYAECYHGGLEQTVRERNLLRFRCGGSLTLVATDLAARGIDIPDVRNVIHYHLPADAATFTHRSGRSTRWENAGTAYLIVEPEERVPDFLTDDQRVVNLGSDLLADNRRFANRRPNLPRPTWAMLYIGRGKKAKLSRGDIAGFLCKKGGINASDLGRIELADHQAYVAVRRACLKSLLTAVSGEKIKGMKTIIEEAHRNASQSR